MQKRKAVNYQDFSGNSELCEVDNDFSGSRLHKVADAVPQLAQDEMLEKTSIKKDSQPCRYCLNRKIRSSKEDEAAKPLRYRSISRGLGEIMC